jgi:hypothetical protein
MRANDRRQTQPAHLAGSIVRRQNKAAQVELIGAKEGLNLRAPHFFNSQPRNGLSLSAATLFQNLNAVTAYTGGQSHLTNPGQYTQRSLTRATPSSRPAVLRVLATQ